MKIFAVTANIEITTKPDWLDGFRARYDKPYAYHVTLKQPCLVEDDQVDEIKKKLSRLFDTTHIPNHAIPLTFNVLKAPKDVPDDICIMVRSTDDEQIRVLQKQIATVLSEYKKYYKPEYQGYEENFKPHITIAQGLNERTCQEAFEFLKQGCVCGGVITKILLTVAANFGPEEANDLKNQTVYKL